MTSDTTLYAGWAGNCYAVTLDAQGGAGGSASVTATYGSAMPSATMPTRTGYTFLGYFDATSGGTKYYNADGTSARTWNKAAATTLYAQWEAKEIPVDGGVKVKVDDEWIKNHGLEGKTEEDVKEVLNATDTTGTGLKKWQNWALGVTDGDANAKPVFKSAAKSATDGKVSFAVPAYTGNAKSGVTVSRKLILQRAADSAAERTSDLALDATAVEVDETDVNAEKPVALYTTVIEFANANGEPVRSENTVGLMYSKPATALSIVAVPWERIGGGAISAADLIDTRDLGDGDVLHVYDKASGKYRSWTLAGGVWTGNDNTRIGEEGQDANENAGSPTDTTIRRGDGVWLERKDARKAFHLFGQLNETPATPELETGWNLCGNAGIAPLDVSTITLGGANDKIFVLRGEGRIRFEVKGGKWGYWKQVESTHPVFGKVVTPTWTEDGDEFQIPVGAGYWYVK